jgi:flagellar hook assembly protein FlgD
MASYRLSSAAAASLYGVHYNSSRGTVVVSYTVQNARRVSMNIVDQSGRQIATIVGEDVSTGQHEAVWDAKQVPAGVYACRIAIDGRDAWAGKIVIGK